MQDRLSRRQLLGTAGATLATATAGCVGGERDESETVEETYDVGDVGSLTVDSYNAVTVTAEERDDVAVTGVKRAASEDGLEDIRLETERSDGTLTLRVDRDGGIFVFRLGPTPTMDLTVRVPTDLQVDRVDTVNGPSEMTGVRGDLTVDAVNGAVTASEVRGDLTVDGVNGDVLASGVSGLLQVDTTNGDVEADGVDGDVDIETTNGDISLAVSPDLDATIDVETTNGDVTITGVGDLTGAEEFPVTVGEGSRDVDLETTNGDVTIDGTD